MSQRRAKILGERIKDERKLVGLTLQEFADEVGTSKSYNHDLENAKITKPSVFRIMDIANVIGVMVDDLIGNDHKLPPTEYTEG